jgi:Flp pilus assembly protein TadG
MAGRRGGSQAGQSTVEFAVLLPVLMLAVLVVIQGGLVVRDQLLVQHAAREGARAAAVSDSVAEVRDAAGRAGPLDPSRMTVTRTARQQGQPVRVSVQYGFRGVVPIVGSLMNRFTLSASVTMRAEELRP